MGNRLKNMLNPSDNGLALTMDFGSQEERKKFLDILSEIQSNGEPQKVPVPQFMEMKTIKGGYQYPFESYNNITEMMVYPSENIIELPIIIDGEKENYVFAKTQTGKIVNLKSSNSKVIDVSIEFNPDRNLMKFTYTSHPKNAKTIEDLINEYKAMLALLDVLFKNNADEEIEKLNDTRNYFKQTLEAYKRNYVLCQKLSINVSPEKMLNEDNSDWLLEKLYLLLVNGDILRKDDKLNNVETVDIEGMKIGQELFATYIQHANLEIFGEQRNLFLVNCVFGAEVKNIEIGEDGKKTIFFKDSEKRPMYCAYTAFLDEKEANEELERILTKREAYEKAIGWTEQVRSLIEN